MFQRRRLQTIGVLAVVIAVSSMLSVHSARSAPARESAVATSPGKNGLIAFTGYLDSDRKTGAIITIGVNGKGRRQITKPDPGVEDSDPDWSRDGSLVVFERTGSPHAIYTVRRDGSGLMRLSPECTYSGPDLETHCEDGAGGSFLPDGSGVVYTRATGNVREFPNGEGWIEHSDIVVRDLSGGNPRVLLRSPPYGGDYRSPQISPDGKRFAYVRANSPLVNPAGGYALFVARADGSEQRRITPWSLVAGFDPDWSPDGKLIVFQSYTTGVGKQSQSYVIRPDGTGLRRLTHFKPGTAVLSASFSPDGKWITFGKSGVGGQADVFVIRVNGKDVRPVTRTARWDSGPDWGPGSS